MTRFKICGLRDPANAVVAAESGADFLGFIFVPGTRRSLEVDQARDIIQEYRRCTSTNSPDLVGLFADQESDEVNRIVCEVGLDRVQLCGAENPEYWRKIKVPVMNQIKVSDTGNRVQVVDHLCDKIQELESLGFISVLDKDVPGQRGGSGQTFDWAIAAEVARTHDFLLAGGLRAENVADAIEIVNPWGVDVSSGVETDGEKSATKIRAFADAVKRTSEFGT